MKVLKLENANRKIVQRLGNFSVLDYDHDISVSSSSAMVEYFIFSLAEYAHF